MSHPWSHTPGPWHTKPWNYDQGKRTVLTVQTDSDAVAQVLDLWCPDERAEELKANAQLIAAAPDLLEALKRLLASPILIGSQPEAIKAYAYAQLAIDKAEGR